MAKVAKLDKMARAAENAIRLKNTRGPKWPKWLKRLKLSKQPNLLKMRKSPESNWERIGEKNQNVYNFQKAETAKKPKW